MIGFIFSLDYEIHGNGSGNFKELVLEPTEKMLSIFEEYGAKLSIMVEAAEFLTLKKYGKFKPVVEGVEEQLKKALSQNHDIQLHLHPQWFDAAFEQGRWILSNEHYSLAYLPKETISTYIAIGKDYLEGIGKQVNRNYKCIAFRAGNWLIQPSRNIVNALEEAGFLYDTSVYKWAKLRKGSFSSDFTDAHSHLISWVVDPDDINKEADRDGLREIPIFTRKVFFPWMLTYKRIMLRRKAVLERRWPRGSQIRKIASASLLEEVRDRIHQFGLFYPKKFDFCRMTFRELKNYADYTIERLGDSETLIPIVLIGHSKDFVNDGSLERLFEYINSRYGDKIRYTTYGELQKWM